MAAELEELLNGGGSDERTVLICAAPDFLEANRVDARDAVLLTSRVDVPHAGLR